MIPPIATAAANPVNLDRMLPVFRDIVREINFQGQLAFNCLDSSALANVSIVSLKSIPHAFYGDRALVKEFDNPLSCRLRFLEAGWIGMASFVYNFVFAVAFGAASLITFRRVKVLNDETFKRCTHLVLAAATVGIGMIGTVSPSWGIKANGALYLSAIVFVVCQMTKTNIFRAIDRIYQRHRAQPNEEIGTAIVNVLWEMTESRLTGNISQIYQRHRARLQENLTQCVQTDDPAHVAEVAPFFNYLDTQLNGNTRTFSNLLQVIQGGREHLPNITVNVSLPLILEYLQPLINSIREQPRPHSAISTAAASMV